MFIIYPHGEEHHVSDASRTTLTIEARNHVLRDAPDGAPQDEGRKYVPHGEEHCECNASRTTQSVEALNRVLRDAASPLLRMR